jgi:hypothetical protein
MFDYNRDFFMCPVHTAHVLNQPRGYFQCYDFMAANKYEQRKLLSAGGIPIPACANDKGNAINLVGETFVVRPFRHSGGLGYRTTTNRLDFVEGREYISVLYPKKREYRVIFVFGKPLIWLRKKPHEGVGNALPWGHENATFQTINDVAASPLSRTDCVTVLTGNPLVATTHICAADILFNLEAAQPYVVLELNLCPALTIEGNREKVVEAIRGRDG